MKGSSIWEPGLARRTASPLLVLGLAVLMLFNSQPVYAKPAGPARYHNPISKAFADAFADPSIIHAKDGWWYAYSTADPLRSGGQNVGGLHITRTKDFRSWQYQGTVFDSSNRPSWATSTSGLWAPDIRYIDGRYVVYFTVTDTELNAGDDSAIGVATSSSPVGPWTSTDAPLVPPRSQGDGEFLWTFDPAGFTDVHGRRYLYFGSYVGGLWVVPMSDDGLTSQGKAIQVAIENRYEGAYVVRHGGWYYLMGSSGNCCAGPTTGYSVHSGRSRSPLGPFIDADGIPLLGSRAGGTLMLTQNGNRWIGAGHHSVVTDNAGRDYVVYHAIDRRRPWLDQPFGTNRRPMLMDRIDWINGWPRTRAGAGPSDSSQPAPVTGSGYGITAADPARHGFKRLATGPIDAQSGRTGRVLGTVRTASVVQGKRLRLRMDVKGPRRFKISLGSRCTGASVTVDPGRGRLTARTVSGSMSRTRTASFTPNGRAWQTLTVEAKPTGLLAQLSESDLNDPYAEVRLRSHRFRLGRAPVRLHGDGAVVDNLSIHRAAVDARQAVAVPHPGKLFISEPFTTPLSSKWTWVRKVNSVTVSGHGLNWPLDSADLNSSDPEADDTAGVLLHDTPPGAWIAQTKLTLDLGVDEERNFQQAGLIAYQDDDNFARLSSVAIGNTRQVEFGRELTTADGRTSYGGAVVGSPARTVWLRLAHTRNATGEHLYRAAVSQDRKTWAWGAVWTFAAHTRPKIGLIAHGGANPPITARFGYLRFYATRSPHQGR